MGKQHIFRISFFLLRSRGSKPTLSSHGFGQRVGFFEGGGQEGGDDQLGDALAGVDGLRGIGVIVEGDSRLAELAAEVEELRRKAQAVAGELTKSRTRAGEQLAREVVAMLSRLGMEQSSFVCAVTPVELSATGGDGVEFRFSSNPKFQPQPLERVASGGEISRVMLCLKALVAGKTNMPTVIFDEIDTGISGRIADVTGQIIAELSAGRQVVNITHLPQVASKGDTHFKVYKDGESGHTQQ